MKESTFKRQLQKALEWSRSRQQYLRMAQMALLGMDRAPLGCSWGDAGWQELQAPR